MRYLLLIAFVALFTWTAGLVQANQPADGCHCGAMCCPGAGCECTGECCCCGESCEAGCCEAGACLCECAACCPQK